MYLNFSEVLAAMGPNAGFVIANEARPGSEYMLNAILPERPILDYNVKDAGITVRSMMAGLVGMDSPYPPTGFVEAQSFAEQTLKVANHAAIPEEVMRQLQAMVRALGAGSTSTQMVQQEVLNFYAKVILQPHFDVAEWLRSQALVFGSISWDFNGKHIHVDYGIPTENMLPIRTGDDAYGGATSKFWDDVLEARRLLHGNLLLGLAHPNTLDRIVSNPENNNLLVAEVGANYVDLQAGLQWASGGVVTHPDARYAIRIYSYDLEGEVFDPSDLNNPTKIPFMPEGKVVYLGKNRYDRVYRVGVGSTDDPRADMELGFTALAPTVEGGGVPGRWGRMIVKENTPWQLEAEAVTNLLPIIQAPEKIVVASTEM